MVQLLLINEKYSRKIFYTKLHCYYRHRLCHSLVLQQIFQQGLPCFAFINNLSSTGLNTNSQLKKCWNYYYASVFALLNKEQNVQECDATKASYFYFSLAHNILYAFANALSKCV